MSSPSGSAQDFLEFDAVLTPPAGTTNASDLPDGGHNDQMGASQRPGLGLFLSEPGRAAADYGAFLAASPLLLWSPRGDGHSVLVLPGFLAQDTSTTTLRLFLRALGYDVNGWSLGRNVGPTAAILDGMAALLHELAARRGHRSAR